MLPTKMLSRNRDRPIDVSFYGRVRRACDRCRERKTRCDALQPCNTCLEKQVLCTYRHIPKKKGPRSPQAKITRSHTESPEHDASVSAIHPPPVVITPSSSPVGPDEESHTINKRHDRKDNLVSEKCSVVNESLSIALDVPNIITGSTEHFTEPRTQDMAATNSSLEYIASCRQSFPTPRARIPTECLIPMVEMFFDHAFPIMPVLDRNFYLSSDFLYSQDPLPADEYALLTALSAIIIVQLNLPESFVQQRHSYLSAELLVEECLHERQNSDYIENPKTSTILTSFFLFGYYGNLERHNKARYFLHEAISFAESINLDDESYLCQLEPRRGQWCRRIFWLLFITERYQAKFAPPPRPPPPPSRS